MQEQQTHSRPVFLVRWSMGVAQLSQLSTLPQALQTEMCPPENWEERQILYTSPSIIPMCSEKQEWAQRGEFPQQGSVVISACFEKTRHTGNRKNPVPRRPSNMVPGPARYPWPPLESCIISEHLTTPACYSQLPSTTTTHQFGFAQLNQ